MGSIFLPSLSPNSENPQICFLKIIIGILWGYISILCCWQKTKNSKYIDKRIFYKLYETIKSAAAWPCSLLVCP